MGFTPVEEVHACTECGTIHYGERPPCNQCGSMGFQRANPADLDDSDAEDGVGIPSPSTHRRRTVLYGLGIVGVLGAGAYAYTAADDYPTKDVTGEPDAAAGIRFDRAEAEILGLINDERASESREHFSRPENVDAFAEYWNKTRVEEDVVDEEAFSGEFNLDSYYGFTNLFMHENGSRIEFYDSAEELAQDVFESLADYDTAHREMTSYEWTRVGMDLHAGPSGDVFSTVVFA